MMKSYTKYRECEGTWTGKVPAHWAVLPATVLFKEVKRKNADGALRNELQFRYGSIIPKPPREYDEETSAVAKGYTVVEPDDIVVNGLNLNYDFVTQRVAQVMTKGIITSAYLMLRTDARLLLPAYATYYLKSLDSKKVFHGVGKGIRKVMNYHAFRRLMVVCPPLEEQRAIVSYIDSKSVEIDALVERRAQIVARLQKLKQAFISRAVSQGLTPDAPVKESGVAWLGPVPAHWEESRVKYVLKKIQAGDWGQEISANNRRCICVRVADFDYAHFQVADLAAPTLRGYRQETIDKLRLEQGDLLLEKSGGGDKSPVGRCVVYRGAQEAVCSNFVEVLRVKDVVLPEFLLYVLSVLYASGHMRYFIKQTTGIQNLQMKRLLAMRLFLPSMAEQKAIVAFLYEKCAQIDELVARHHAMIDRLKELKTSLISAAVTGKTDVR